MWLCRWWSNRTFACKQENSHLWLFSRFWISWSQSIVWIDQKGISRLYSNMGKWRILIKNMIETCEPSLFDWLTNWWIVHYALNNIDSKRDEIDDGTHFWIFPVLYSLKNKNRLIFHQISFNLHCTICSNMDWNTSWTMPNNCKQIWSRRNNEVYNNNNNNKNNCIH